MVPGWFQGGSKWFRVVPVWFRGVSRVLPGRFQGGGGSRVVARWFQGGGGSRVVPEWSQVVPQLFQGGPVPG